MKIRFERRWCDQDGTCIEAKSFFGPRIELADEPTAPTDYTDWYFNEAANGMVVVPDGWVAVEGRYPEEMEDDKLMG